MPEIVAKLINPSPSMINYLRAEGAEVLKDYYGNDVTHPDDAYELLAPPQYTYIQWFAPELGAPKPKRRPR